MKDKLKASDPEALAAYKILISEAEVLRKNNYFPRVTNKKLSSVSEDIHDYVSMATYYWPNPKSENGLPYVGTDGKPNPEVAKINNYSNLVQLSNRVKIFGLAYYFSDDIRYVQAAKSVINVFFIRSDTRMNPNFNHAQFIKGENNGRIEGIIEARFLLDFLDGLELLKESPQFDKQQYLELQKWFKDFLSWMENSEIGKRGFKLKNNIETAYHLQRLAYSTFLNDKVKVKNIYDENLKSLINSQIKDDGVQWMEMKRVKSTNYSISNLKYWIDIESILNNNGLEIINPQNFENSKIAKAKNIVNKMDKSSLDPPHKQQYSSIERILNNRTVGNGIRQNNNVAKNSLLKVKSIEDALLVLTNF